MVARLRVRRGPGAAPVDSFAVVGSTGGSVYTYAPLLRDAQLWRSPQVAQDAEIINLQDEVAIPSSPTVTLWTVAGPDANYFYALTDGCIAFRASTRASIPRRALSITVTAFNGAGSSSCAVTVNVPADSDCFFVDPASGSDAASGLWGAPWQHVPKTTGWTGGSPSMGAGDVLFFKATSFRAVMAQGTTGTADALPYQGSSDSARFVYSGTGWGGRAAIDGSDIVTGWTAVTQVEVAGNPDYLSIDKIDMGANGGVIVFSNATIQPVFDDDTLVYPAQWPAPTDLYNFQDPLVDQTGGMWQVSTSAIVSPRMTQSGTTITIVDPRIAARYGNVALSAMPPLVMVWAPGNNISYFAMTGYTFATSTITCTSSSSSGPASVGGLTAYALAGHPLDITRAAQYAVSNDRLTVYAWLPNGGTTSVARRVIGCGLSQTGVGTGPNWTTWKGFTFQRCTGSAFQHGRTSGATLGFTASDIIVRQNWLQDEAAAFMNVGGTSTMTDPILERVSYDENPRASGFVGGATVVGLSGTPTAAQVRAYAYGKFRWFYIPAWSMSRSSFQQNNTSGCEISENVINDLYTIHGDGLPLYNNCFYNYIYNNLFDNMSRPYTVSLSDLTTNRHNTLEANVFLSRDTYAFNMFNGEPGGVFLRNIGMNGPDGASNTTNGIDIRTGLTITLSHNVLSGITSGTPYAAATGGAFYYDIQNNLVTVNSLPANSGSNQVQTGNVVATGAPFRVWDYVLSAEMQTALGAGPVGMFWSV